MHMKEKHKIRFSAKDLLLMGAVFLVIYMSSSYNITIIKGTISLVVSAICGLIVVLFGDKNKVNLKLLINITLIFSTILLTHIFTNDAIKDTAIMIITVFIAMLFVIGLDYKKYCEIYVTVMLLIAIYSLIVYVLGNFTPSLIRIFPKAYYRPTLETYNLGLTFINLRSKLIRNMGIFWEPGAYQTYLIFAILIERFSLCQKRNWVVVIFMLTLITTWSTAGIINLLILILIFIIHKNQNVNLKFFKTMITATVVFIIIIGLYSIASHDIQYAAVGKITVYLSSDKSRVTSASVRFSSFTYLLRAYLKSPIVGLGHSGLKNSILGAGHTMTTNTPINWFATYGTMFGFLHTMSVFKLAKKMNNNSKILLILIMISMILAISTEQYLRNISIIIFLLYGLAEPTSFKINEEYGKQNPSVVVNNCLMEENQNV